MSSTALPGADASARSRTWTRFGMPALIAVLLIGLYFWVTGQELDSVASRPLTTENVMTKLMEHIQLSAYSTILVLVLAVPLGIIATRPGRERIARLIVGLGNAGQAIPSIGMLAILFYVFFTIPFLPSTGVVPVVAALTAYSFLPILRNTMVGLRGVDDAILEAGRGMGLSNRQVLRQLELPLAIPVILAGVRTALILNVGTAALAFIIGGGGLGELISTGYQLKRAPVLITGAILTAALALLVDWLAGLAEESLTPEGI